MNFYERYAELCAKKGIDPCAQKTAEMFGVTRATISIWNKKNTAPKAETLRAMADALGVSADYLLGRTDDPTDYVKNELNNFDQNTNNSEINHTEAENALRNEHEPDVLRKYNRLDNIDQARAKAFIDGLLASDKYATK